LVLFGDMGNPRSRHSIADTPLQLEPGDILDDLGCLQIETLTYHRASQQLRHARTSQSEALAAQALGGIWQASAELKAAALRLRTFVLGFEEERLGPSFESFGELALRAEMSFVLWRPSSGWSDSWVGSWLRGITPPYAGSGQPPSATVRGDSPIYQSAPSSTTRAAGAVLGPSSFTRR
jgi:hypothetical protein